MPANVVADQPIGLLRHPGLDDVALAEQLGARVARQLEVTREEPFQHQEPEPAAVAVLVRNLPVPRPEDLDLRYEVGAGIAYLRSRDAEPELRVCLE